MQFFNLGESNLLNFRTNLKLIVLVMVTTSLVLTTSAEAASPKSKIPSGYTKWKDGSEFAYKWITKTPKDDYYRGTWQGIVSVISVVYVNGFSCSPELPDGTTNSVEVEIDIIRTGNNGFSGRGYADTIRKNSPFKIEISFYGAPKGYGASVKQVKLKSLECRM
jgi:hypothetical protein